MDIRGPERIMANSLAQKPLARSTPELLGRYRLLGDLGGSAKVMLAEDGRTSRQVAVKFWPIEPAARETIVRELHQLKQLEQDHIVPVLDAGEEDGQAYLVMEILKGESLQSRLKREHRLPFKEALRITREAASALVALHAQNLLHRNIAPAHIWLEPSGRTRLLGLGSVPPEENASLLQRLDGAGTPGYLSPEQAAGEPLTFASDLFSLGCVFFQAATGEPPFRGDTAPALIRAAVLDHPRNAREINPEIPEAIAELIARLLSKLPLDRPASAQDLERRLLEWLDPFTPKLAPLPPKTPGPMIFPASKRILETIAASKTVVEPTKTAVITKVDVIVSEPAAGKKRSWLPDLIAGILLIAAGAGLYLWWKASNEVHTPPPANKAATSKQ